MNDELPNDLRPIVDFFGLPDTAVVEKDWHVVKALAAIAALDPAPLRLVFGGGTALSRAHRLIRRMSEDIDLKIVADQEPSRPALRRLRNTVTKALLDVGFKFDPENREHRESGNESRYTVFRVPYAPRGPAPLRPEIMIELGVWPLRGPTIDLPVSSFVAEAMKRSPELARIACVSVTQTVAEKFVALTRRVAAECDLPEAGRDPALVRHIYDLHVVRPHYDPAGVAALIREVIPHDAKVFASKSSAYRHNPMAETLKAVGVMQSDPYYARQFAEFHRLMVYGDRVEYAACLATVKDLADRLRK